MWNTACASVRRVCVNRRCLAETASQLSKLKMTQQDNSSNRNRHADNDEAQQEPQLQPIQRGRHQNGLVPIQPATSSHGDMRLELRRTRHLNPSAASCFLSLFHFSVPDTSFCLREVSAFTLRSGA